MVPVFTILHPLVDACSVSVLVIGGMSWQRALAYNALAFALQFPMGVVLDARPRLVKGAFAASLALTLVGVVVGTCGGCAHVGSFGYAGHVTLPQVALVAACVGNALFHLAAGKAVLDAHEGRGGPIGLFISTGALGLFAGLKLAGGYGLWCCFGFGAALAVVGALAVWRGLHLRYNHQKTKITLCRDCGGQGLTALPMHWGFWMLSGLFALVAWRSWAGLLAGGMTNAAGLGFALAGASGRRLRPQPLAASRPRCVRDERRELWYWCVDDIVKGET